MAYEAAVSSLSERLDDLLIQEAPLFKSDIKWIHTELNQLRRFMKDADSRQSEDEEAKNWVAQIRDLCYDLEDFLEETSILSRSAKKGDGFLERLKSPFSVTSERRTHHEVAKQMERLKQKMRDIKIKREDYGIRDINEGGREASSSTRSVERHRRSSALFQKSEVVGLQDEIKKLSEQLNNEEVRRSVISIVGMGGSGKTALARKVYDDVKNDFLCHAFIYLSQQYEMKDVLMRIIKCVTSPSQEDIEKIEKLNLEELAAMLRGDLKEKRYLVVIDDIWSIEAWEKLNLILPDTGQKSRVMLTTRIKQVALLADPLSNPHKKRLLEDEEGWELFKKKIFPEGDLSADQLEKTGKNILAKCGGLPLAILVVGGLLARKKKTESTWSRVLESVNWHPSGSFDQCRRLLALSYWDLPYYLKPCFLYLGLFPEDYEINSSKLIRLWIAEGFIEKRDNRIIEEDVAEDYLEELVDRSMIQVASCKSNGSVGKCRLHNLLRDVSISEARQNNFFTVCNDDGSSSSSTSVRRLAIYRNIDGDETKNHSIETLRSILYFFDSKVDELKLPNTSSKLLRVMNAESEESSRVSLPEEVGEFVHLKFLEFSRKYSISRILPSIGNLSSLQTLKVFGASETVTLPNTIWNLKELRHLRAYNFHIEGQPHLSNLRNLQTLRLIAGSWIKEGLGKLTNLRKLGIFGDVSSYDDTLPYCIEKLCNLRLLKLFCGGPIPPFMPFTRHQKLYKISLEGSLKKLPVLPLNLIELYLCLSELEQDAISTLEKLQHLKILKLHKGSYLSKQMTCSQGGFPQLELLELCQLPLEDWIVEEGAMMSLKIVKPVEMSALKTETLPERVRALLKEGEPV